MKFQDLRQFMAYLEARGELRRIHTPVDPHLEITEVCDRVLRQGGPALLFESPGEHPVPVLANLFGTTRRIALGMGRREPAELQQLGEDLAQLKEPDQPGGARDLWRQMPLVKKAMTMAPRTVNRAPCQEREITGTDVDLAQWPVQTCWPEDAGPLVTWPLVITRGPDKERANAGIYRMQVLNHNQLIMRWLDHRGGALDWQAWRRRWPDQPFPVAVAIGADPATMLAAVTPVPDTLSEFAFAGLLRDSKTVLTQCRSHDLNVPAHAEIVLEGFIHPEEYADEGPFGDHTGYYNETARFPVFTVERITHRTEPVYHSTYTGRPPDEPAVLGSAMNELFLPILKKQFPEILDFYLPPEGCSYRWALIRIRKQYPGHARRIMMGIWSVLPQFSYTKWVVVVDEDIDVRNWSDVIWGLSTRTDPARDTLTITDTPMDYLDFASPRPGLGSRMGLDATNKWPGETDRDWGRPIVRDPEVTRRIDQVWAELGI